MNMDDTRLLPLRLGDLRDLTDAELLDHIATEYIEGDIAPEQLGTILVAYESVGDYGCDSSSYFLIERDGELYEIHGGHCSCNGFEGQWEPQRVTPGYLVSPQWSMSIGGYDDHGQEHRDVVWAWLQRKFGGDVEAALAFDVPACAIPTRSLHVDKDGCAVDLRLVDDHYLRNIVRWSARRPNRRVTLSNALDECRVRDLLPTIEELTIAVDFAEVRGFVNQVTSIAADEARTLVDLWVGFGKHTWTATA